MTDRPRRHRGLGSIHHRPAQGLWEGRLDISQPGEPRRRKSVYGKTAREVERKMGELRRQLDQHGDLPSSHITLTKWLDVWLRDIAPRRIKETSMIAYRSKVEQYIRPQLGSHRLDKLKTDHVRAWDRWLEEERQVSLNTRHAAHVVLGAVLDAAMKDGKVTRNVAAVVGSPGQEKNPPRSLSPDEILKVKGAAAGTRLESRWLAALMLGLRQGEALGLGWGQVDLEGSVIHVTRALAVVNRELRLQTPKSKSSARSLWIPPSLHGPLTARRDAWVREPRGDAVWAPEGLLWAAEDGKPYHTRRDYQHWHDLLDAAGVKRVSLHVTRHSAATALAMEGIPTGVIRDILGHSSIAITNGYIHPDVSGQRAAWEIADPQRALG